MVAITANNRHASDGVRRRPGPGGCENASMTWSLQNSVAYECAREALTDVIGIRMAQIYEAEARGAAGAEQLERLQAEVQALVERRRELMPEDLDAIAEIRQTCGAIVRAHRQPATLG